jgi:hypothetical protein
VANNDQPGPLGSVLTSKATVVAGFVFAAATLCFLMWLVSSINQIQCSQAGLIALVFGLGSALSTSFLGGYAAATGPVTIPYFGNRPINVALGGGILALVITTVMAWIVVGKNCTPVPDAFAECKVSPPHVHIGCVRVTGLGQGPGFDGTLSVRAGPALICERKFLLVNDNIAEVQATHGQWNYVKALTGEGAGTAEGWVSISFITPTPCP